MDQQNACERVLALLNETVELLIRGESAPDSPVEKVTTTDERREMRRAAERLLSGMVDVRFKNLYTAKQLAAILLATVARDEIRHKVREEFFRLSFEIGAAILEDPAGTRKVFDEFFLATLLESKEGGPGSEGESRYRQLQKIVRFVKLCTDESRRQKPSKAQRGPRLAHDSSYRVPMIPAEEIDSPLPGETVIPIPAEDPVGFNRMFIRIGLGPSSWVGRFACGLSPVTTISMMPDRQHLFVSARGAGYIVDFESRKLVERTGTAVRGVHRDALMTFFVIDHGGVSLEAFGVATRLWKTGPLGAGEFRNIVLVDDEVVGEALQPSGDWGLFAIKVVTGEVRKDYGSSP
ncbi:MAG TPA: hypothetical protein VGJ82_16870 [Thermoanaerobaculia bacterium]